MVVLNSHGIKLAVIGVVAMALSVTSLSAQVNPLMDAKKWSAVVTQGGGMAANPGGIKTNGSSLVFSGYHLAREAQYALSSDLVKGFENKLVSCTVTLDGVFVGADSSFLAFVSRASSPATIFWNQQCYAVLFKANQIEVQKHGKGTNPNLTYKYSDFPALGFKSFPIGKPVKVTYGVVKEGAFQKIILKLNDTDICAVLDNRYGQTVKVMPNNVFMIGVIATNKESPGDLTSKSSLTLSNMEVK